MTTAREVKMMIIERARDRVLPQYLTEVSISREYDFDAPANWKAGILAMDLNSEEDRELGRAAEIIGKVAAEVQQMYPKIVF